MQNNKLEKLVQSLREEIKKSDENLSTARELLDESEAQRIGIEKQLRQAAEKATPLMRLQSTDLGSADILTAELNDAKDQIGQLKNTIEILRHDVKQENKTLRGSRKLLEQSEEEKQEITKKLVENDINSCKRSRTEMIPWRHIKTYKSDTTGLNAVKPKKKRKERKT